MNYLLLNLWLFISTISISNYALVVADAPDQGCQAEGEEFENTLLSNFGNNWSKGFEGMFILFDSMNKTMTALTEKIQNLEAAAILNLKTIENLKSEVAEIKSKRDSTAENSTAEILNVETTANNSNFTNISDENLTTNLTKFQSSVTLHIGKSFKGSSLSEIISRVSSAGYLGQYTAVVFANYLDETINDFTIYNENKAIFNPAPTSIPALTEEVFTFYEPACCYVSFSYVIPSNAVRVAAISQAGAWGKGLAFVSRDTDMKVYYESKKGINGSSVHECCDHLDRNITVGYQNLQARLFVRAEGPSKATYRIEIIKLF